MSEIYIRKRAFWNEERETYKNKIIVIGLIVLFLVLVGLSNRDRNESCDNLPNKDNIDNSDKVFNFRSRIYSKMLKWHKKKIIKQKMKFGHSKPKHKKMNKLLQCEKYEEDYYFLQFQREVQSNLFFFCPNSLLSKDIQTYYTFQMNRRKLTFQIENDYVDDVHIFNNHTCFSSGKAQIALTTKEIPTCIELKNLHINNFNHPSRNAHFLLKFHIFKIKANKIHIYPVAKQIINHRHISGYFSLDEQNDSSNGYLLDKNLLLYKDPMSKSKFIRICNLMPEESRSFYENKFWMELNWDPEIQNLLCFEELGYIS